MFPPGRARFYKPLFNGGAAERDDRNRRCDSLGPSCHLKTRDHYYIYLEADQFGHDLRGSLGPPFHRPQVKDEVLSRYVASVAHFGAEGAVERIGGVALDHGDG